MKKITLFLLLLCPGFSALAQATFEASENYGKLQNVIYDANVANKLYAATQGNHIVVSTDNGATWSLFYSSPGANFISDMKMLPGNAALSFSVRDAIVILDLATQTVTATIPVPPSNVEGAGQSTINSYAVYDASTILVDTVFSIGFANYGKTFYSYDAGASWTEIYYTLDNDNVFINNVAMSPIDPQNIFLARGNGDGDVDGGLWISDDAGETFTESLAGVTIDPITFHPTNTDEILVGSSIGFGGAPENLYRSTDGGLSWNIVPINWTDETLNNITVIKYCDSDPDHIIVLEENEIASSIDGGATWSSTVYPVGISTDYYYGLDASYNPSDKNQIAISTDLFPQFTFDGGATMSQIKAKFYNIVSTSVASYAGTTHLYYGSNGGRLHRDMSTNVTSAYDIESPDSFNPVADYMVADPLIPGRVFTYASMGDFGGNVNVSFDYGATTANIYNAFSDDLQALTIDPNNSNIVYVALRSGEDGNMVKLDISDLSNVVTTEISTPNNGVVTGIAINPANSSELYIAKSAKVYKSTDGGETWTEKSLGLENIAAGSGLIWDMVQNPLNPAQLTLGSNIGIYTTTDWAENWTNLLPGMDIRRIAYSPAYDGLIVGSEFANINSLAQIVYTTNHGEDWTTVSQQELNYVQSYSMDYVFEGTTIQAYLATTDLGIMKYDITDLILGVNHPSLQNSIGLYPNPSNGIVNVMTADGLEINSVVVYSIGGQKVLESGSSTFDISRISNGIYVVKANASNGKTFIQKLVKN
jgi:photosystem II stability/assembly factor-like uncharacterized protein